VRLRGQSLSDAKAEHLLGSSPCALRGSQQTRAIASPNRGTAQPRCPDNLATAGGGRRLPGTNHAGHSHAHVPRALNSCGRGQKRRRAPARRALSCLPNTRSQVAFSLRVMVSTLPRFTRAALSMLAALLAYLGPSEPALNWAAFGTLYQFAALRRSCLVSEALAPSRPGIRDACS